MDVDTQEFTRITDDLAAAKGVIRHGVAGLVPGCATELVVQAVLATHPAVARPRLTVVDGGRHRRRRR